MEILLVEDTSTDRLLSLEALAEIGFDGTTHTVADGEEAVAFLKRLGKHANSPRPNLVLLDLNLPRKTGYDVLREIKTDAALMDIPVVIFTSSACEKDMARAYDERANCYVRKPTDFGGYRDVLRQIRKFWGWEALPKTAKALATILFVEDETTIRGMAKLYLETNGYTVIEAADGVQALELWATHQGEIDLVLTDMMMPRGVSGYELVRKLQADRADVPVIFVSGYTSETFGEGTVLDTATNFLQKPYRLKNLGEMVHDCLAHRVAA